MKAHKTTFIIGSIHGFGYDPKACVSGRGWFSVTAAFEEGMILSGTILSEITERAPSVVDVYGCKIKS